MSKFDKETLKYLEKLCRIQCSPEEEQEILDTLPRILGYIDQLNEVDTSKTAPCRYVLQDVLKNLMRDDEIGETLSREKFLNNAPDHVGGMIRVPTVLKASS